MDSPALERHRVSWEIRQGDALELLLHVPDGEVEGVITDPPYSSGGAFRGDRTPTTGTKYVQSGQVTQRADFMGDNRDQRAYGYWCALWLSQCLRVSKPGSPICVFADWRQLSTTIDAVQAGGWVWRGIVPWNKTEGVRPQMGRFRAQCEYVVWGSNGPMPQREEVGVLPGFFQCSPGSEEREHIATKPIAVMEQIVRIVPPGGLVLDPFAGSGSTGLAALKTGRRFLGFELSIEWAESARRRLGTGPLFAALGAR